MAELSDPTTELTAAPERKPFSGFLPRLGTFLIDCFLLYWIIKLLDMPLHPALLKLNPFLPWLGFPLAFIYFWIGNGPLTKGRTLGKIILNLHVIDPNGRTLTPRAALRRTLIQTSVFLILLNVSHNPEAYVLIFPPAQRYAALATCSMIGILALTFLITLVFSIVMHPYKRGLHDLWAGSYVTPNPTPSAFQQTLNGEPDPFTSRKIANQLRFTLVFWILIFITLSLQTIKVYTNLEYRKKKLELAGIQERNPIPPYTMVEYALPDARRRQEFREEVIFQREHAQSKGETVPTTETLRARALADDETIAVYCVRQSGPFSPADLNDPFFRKSMEQLRRTLWARWQSQNVHSTALTGSTLQAKSFAALLFEPFQLLYYNNDELRARVQGPADPAKGPLTFAEFHVPQPGSANNANPESTTTTMPVTKSTHETPTH